MAQPKRQSKTQSQNLAMNLAEDLHKHHTTAEAVFKTNPQAIVYTEANVLKILTKHGFPDPDFEAYSKVATDMPQGYMNNKKELLRLVTIIQEGMKKKGLNNTQLAKEMNTSKGNITTLLSGQNMTATTMMKLERILNIKLLNH